ncbi:hypothetical protein BC832DRAFT_224704 [Gaertneriomyces semiglobifer]|nr:hypothetical protein BC832DRAFT_224704 [Gaertneriomyces semiglobifer]
MAGRPFGKAKKLHCLFDRDLRRRSLYREKKNALDCKLCSIAGIPVIPGSSNIFDNCISTNEYKRWFQNEMFKKKQRLFFGSKLKQGHDVITPLNPGRRLKTYAPPNPPRGVPPRTPKGELSQARSQRFRQDQFSRCSTSNIQKSISTQDGG